MSKCHSLGSLPPASLVRLPEAPLLFPLPAVSFISVTVREGLYNFCPHSQNAFCTLRWMREELLETRLQGGSRLARH